MAMKKKNKRSIYRFNIGVLDSRSSDKIISVHNLNVDDARKVFKDLLKKFK